MIYPSRLCGLVVRVPGYRSRGPEFDSRLYQIIWEAVGLERGPLSLVSITEELLEWKSNGPVSRKPRLTSVGIRCADHATPSIRKSWHEVRRQAAVAQDQSHGGFFLWRVCRFLRWPFTRLHGFICQRQHCQQNSKGIEYLLTRLHWCDFSWK
jgi:hypothetical protein